MVDPFLRKGYRFKGPATIHEPGTRTFDAGIARLRAEGSTLSSETVNAIVVIEVRDARPLISPAYNGTTTEHDQLRTYQARYAHLHAQYETAHNLEPT